ncbi:MAG: 50S ribosomal protein L18 [Candidatus Berkelbacteria bacterium Licking1014_7]|uniref:50S ribosomal protein L18 n=1 Tax=Candidatus Berkelbacteria bacterium Licking1014_7 TaxID=2017147 RepID=A0A554LKI9_9BACT|nr:MAG: 50S ribosomal protein L18 [Candidatus Berkelbacteria bacterium Licking1014_7]
MSNKKQYKLTISKSLKHISGQVADLSGFVVASATSKGKQKNGAKLSIAYEIGKDLAQKIQDKKITNIFFDRKKQKYHGRIKNFIQALRDTKIKI